MEVTMPTVCVTPIFWHSCFGCPYLSVVQVAASTWLAGCLLSKIDDANAMLNNYIDNV